MPRSHSRGKSQRREHGGDDHHDHRDQSRHDVVPRFQLGVEPDALLDLQRRPEVGGAQALHAVQRPFLFVNLGNGLRVAQRNRARVRIDAGSDDLHGRFGPRRDPPGEIVGDDQRHQGLARIDRLVHVALVVDAADQREVGRAGETGDQLAAFGRAALVPHDERHVVDIQGQRVAEQQQHQDRDCQRHAQAPRIAKHVQELLAGDGRHASGVHRRTSSWGCSARSWASIRETKRPPA